MAGFGLTLVLFASVVSSVTVATSAYKVLGLFPHPAISHFHFFEPVLRGLAAAGHDVTVLSMFPQKVPLANYTDLSLQGDVLTEGIDLQSDWFIARRQFGHMYEVSMARDWAQTACDNAYNASGLQQILRDRQHFDVVLMEHFNTDCLMGVAWHIQAPVIGMSSCVLMPWHHDRIGNPHIPSYIPTLFQPSSEQMTFSQRFANFIDLHVMRMLYRFYNDPVSDAKLKQVFGENVPSAEDLAKQTSLMFVNQHYSMVGSRPLSPALVEIGGIHIKDTAPLSPELQKYLDEAEAGVIYVSWGSMIRATTLPDDKRQSMVEAFGSLKQRVLWKWENDTIPNKPSNVRIARWLPQLAILCHPNVKLFVTHGGMMSSTEAAHCGVPVLSTPFFGDQAHNAAAFVNRKMGVVVDYEDITKESMLKSIQRALQPEYSAHARQVAYTFNHRIQTPLETAIWWVEHVANTKGSPLTKSHSVYMSVWSYTSLDVIGLIVSIVLTVIASWWWLLGRCFRRSKNTNIKSKFE